MAKMENTDSLNQNQLLTRMYTKMEEGGGGVCQKVSFSNPLLSQQYLFNRQSTSEPGSDNDSTFTFSK